MGYISTYIDKIIEQIHGKDNCGIMNYCQSPQTHSDNIPFHLFPPYLVSLVLIAHIVPILTISPFN